MTSLGIQMQQDRVLYGSVDPHGAPIDLNYRPCSSTDLRAALRALQLGVRALSFMFQRVALPEAMAALVGRADHLRPP